MKSLGNACNLHLNFWKSHLRRTPAHPRDLIQPVFLLDTNGRVLKFTSNTDLHLHRLPLPCSSGDTCTEPPAGPHVPPSSGRRLPHLSPEVTNTRSCLVSLPQPPDLTSTPPTALGQPALHSPAGCLRSAPWHKCSLSNATQHTVGWSWCVPSQAATYCHGVRQRCHGHGPAGQSRASAGQGRREGQQQGEGAAADLSPAAPGTLHARGAKPPLLLQSDSATDRRNEAGLLALSL